MSLLSLMARWTCDCLPKPFTDATRCSNGLVSRHKSVKRSQPGVLQPIPAGANPRVLCLDGGGIRGIVQLEVLRGIERALGDHIAIQAFFDLIVGTGFGGLLAMTMSLRGRTVDSCIDEFKTICDRAFKPKLKAVPGVKSITAALGTGERYKPKPLHDALKGVFGEKESLLDSPRSFNTTNRVAVVSSSGPGQEAFLLSNYRRSTTTLDEETHIQDPELRIWEAVAAAIADPAYHQPFEKDGKTYCDGGVKSSDSASMAEQERQLLWPDVEDPDIFLSIGTGQEKQEVLRRTSTNDSDEANRSRRDSVRLSRRMSRRWSMRREEEIIDTEFAWTKFRGKIERDESEETAKRYVRLNPDLGRAPPAPDSKHDIDSLQANVQKSLQTPEMLATYCTIAHQLVASSFYLDSRATVTDEQGEQVFTGTIACRFKYGSDQLRALGQILQSRATDTFEPYFLIKPDASSKYRANTIKLTRDKLRVMATRGIFALPSISIPIYDAARPTSLTLTLSPPASTSTSTSEPESHPISGFPTLLLTKSQSTSLSPAQPRRRALSAQLLPAPSAASSLSRSNTTATAKAPKRATYAGPASFGASKRLSIGDMIAEEREAGTPVAADRGVFWGELEGRRAARETEAGTMRAHGRSESVATDLEVLMDGGRAQDVGWSPLVGG